MTKENPNISTKELFHFTSKGNLQKILETGFFRPGFSHECLIETIGANFLVPMSCFCDIPLSQINDHVNDYGSYGLGMAKSWAKKKGITPVLYLHEDSIILEEIKRILRSNQEIQNAANERLNESIFQEDVPLSFFDDNRTNIETIKIEQAYKNLIKHIKPERGFNWDKNQNQFGGNEVVFYNEREWRYAPRYAPTFECSFSGERANSYEGEYKKACQLLGEVKALKFNPKDIEYIILAAEEEKEDMKDFLDNIYSENKAASEDLKGKIKSLKEIQSIEVKN